MKNNFMIDLETLGTDYDSAIIEIAAAQFDITTGEIIKEVVLDINPSEWNKRTFSGDTLCFWMECGNEPAKKRIFSTDGHAIPLDEALDRLSGFLLPDGTNREDLVVWCEGTDFDIPLLKSAYGESGTPWLYHNVRDVRTVASLSPSIKEQYDKEFAGTEHSAIDDCRRQVMVLVDTLNSLILKDKKEPYSLRMILPIYSFHDERDIPDDMPFIKNAGAHDERYLILEIYLKEGVIKGWPKDYGPASFNLKVMDGGKYNLYDKNHNVLKSYRGYVPNKLLPDKDGCGDYIHFDIDSSGKITNWYKEPDYSEFFDGNN